MRIQFVLKDASYPLSLSNGMFSSSELSTTFWLSASIPPSSPSILSSSSLSVSVIFGRFFCTEDGSSSALIVKISFPKFFYLTATSNLNLRTEKALLSFIEWEGFHT